MQRGFGYSLQQNLDKTFPEYCVLARSIPKHYFGQHEDCGPYCRGKELKEKDPVEYAKLGYQDANKHPYLFSQVMAAVSPYLTTEKLQETFHPVDTNKNENMNKQVTKYMPKGVYFCSTLAGRGRVFTCYGVDTVGLDNFYTRLLASKGQKTYLASTKKFLEWRDRRICCDYARKCSLKYKYDRKQSFNYRVGVKERAEMADLL